MPPCCWPAKSTAPTRPRRGRNACAPLSHVYIPGEHVVAQALDGACTPQPPAGSAPAPGCEGALLSLSSRPGWIIFEKRHAWRECTRLLPASATI